MICDFEYNENLDFIEVEEKREINVNSITEGYKLLKQNNDLPRKLNILLDARESTLNLNINEVPQIINESSEALSCYQCLKEAIIVKRPIDTALATLISKGIKRINYSLGVFSTREAALHWLLS